jgi:hypothetical protein
MSGAVLTLAPPVAAALVRGLGRTLRVSVIGAEHVRELWHSPQPIIYAAWHGQLLMLPFVNERLRRTLGARPVHVLASRSRDGELLARFAARFGFPSVRGSSSRGGAEALRALARALRDGHDVAIAPDGPRGPRGQAQPGAVSLSALSGAPLVPVAFAAHPAWRLATWDAFEVPWPFGRGAVVFGPPIATPTATDRRLAGRAVEDALGRATAAAERAVGRTTGQWAA